MKEITRVEFSTTITRHIWWKQFYKVEQFISMKHIQYIRQIEHFQNLIVQLTGNLLHLFSERIDLSFLKNNLNNTHHHGSLHCRGSYFQFKTPWTGVAVILIVFCIRSCIWYEFCILTFPSWVLISRMDGVVCCNARCWHRGTCPSVYCCVELRCSRFRLHSPQSLDTPVGLDTDKVSKWQPVSPCGHMVIYTEFTLDWNAIQHCWNWNWTDTVATKRYFSRELRC